MGILDFLTGGGDEDEDTRTTIQRSRIPEEISPFATDLLQDAQKLYRERLAAGVPVYDAPRIAPLTPDQLASQAGLRALVGTSRPLQDEALAGFLEGKEEFVDLSPADLETYLSPFQRSVTDIEKRKAQDVFTSDIMPRFEKRAADAGGMSGLGTRAGIEAGQLQEAYMQQQADIEAKGLQSAYRDAQNLYKEGQAKKRLAATDIAKAAPQRFASGLSEQGLLKTIGGEEQALAQRALDQAYARFQEKQDYPQQQLADYSKFVYGNPLMAQRDVTTITPRAPSTTGTDLLGLGAGAFNMFGRGGGGTEKGFSMGQLFGTGAEGGGIASLPVVARQNSSQVGTPEDDVVHGLIPTEITEPQELWERPLPPPDRLPAPAPEEKPLTPSEQRKALFREREEAREAAAGRRTGIDWATLQKAFAGADPRKSPLHAIAGAFAAEGEAVKQKGVKAAEEKAKLLDKQLTSELALLAAQEKAEASEALEWTKARAKRVGVKAADYNSARKSFLDMLHLGRFVGHTNAKGDIVSITRIDGQAITPEETKRLEKIMSTMFATVASSGIPKAIEEARVALNVTNKPPPPPKVYKKGDIVTKTRKNGEVGKYEYLGPNEWRKVN